MGNQHDFIHGIMTVRVRGKLIEPFLQACTRRGCQISNMKWVNDEEIIMSIRLNEWTIYRQLRKKYRIKLSIMEGKGIPFLYKQMIRRTSLVIAFVMAVVFIFLLSNTLWSIKVDGLTPELEANVESKLKSYGVSPGKLTIGMSDPNEIQSKLLNDIPDLLWVGVKKQGTSYQLYGVEKTIHDTDKNNRPSNLVAAKKGMVVKAFIKKGRPLVGVYDVVKKGQPLATGILVDDKDTFVHAEGEVIAETWYKVEQTLPLKQVVQLTDGEVEKQYSVSIGPIQIPVWGWWSGKEGMYREEAQATKWEILGKQIPIQLMTVNHYRIDQHTLEATKENLKKVGVQAASQSLKQYLSKDSEIKGEKVLHQRNENGKVKLILLFKVHENIAVTKYISQGD
ncbi:sporulation protein YqfD [Halobacillus sp. BBL2006]|uniref:sporulation protein YqfD n=1 Tax=Halobacillus sp. BBL2006 TaxID=1543706 RepID=UPI0005429194|nr:sporulation protein YqfD [Halobacillus sp. BBL2006]KHE72837.1 stage IV sporulation protein [Halobacillus sp. BBL2006]